jgi:hypothetical protein
MSQIVFDFKDLITHCLHDEEIKFTNAISQKTDSKALVSDLIQNFQLTCQETELKELFQQEHFHFVQNSYVVGKIKRLVDNPYFDYNKFCQIPLGKETRFYGNLKKIKHTNLYLFKSLVLDPNHLIYNEKNFKKLKNLTCLFSKNDCSEVRKKQK